MLDIAIIVFDSVATRLRPLNIRILTELTIPYSNPKYLGSAEFQFTGVLYSNSSGINLLRVLSSDPYSKRNISMYSTKALTEVAV